MLTRRPVLIPLILAIAALASIWLLAQQAEYPPDDVAQVAPATPSVATTVLSVLPTPDDAPTPRPVLVTTSVSQLLMRYLTAESSRAGQRPSWAGHIRDVAVGLQTATVHTDLGNSPGERIIADDIVAAVERFAASPLGQGLVAPDVAVLGASQQPLAGRTGSWLARRSRQP